MDTKDTHPGFRVTCEACGGTNVIVESCVGWSGTSGAWGDVSLTCVGCEATTMIWEPY